MKWNLRMSDLDLLKANPKNPRKISDPQLEGLRKSLAEFGDLSGVVFNSHTGHLVGGHQRIKAIPPGAEVRIEREYDVPTRTGTVAIGVIVVEGEEFAYRVVDWDEQRELLANIAANHHGGEDDLPKLGELLKELEFSPEDLALSGLTDEEIAKAIAAVASEPQPAGQPGTPGSGAGSLSERFLVPPFSVLDTRQGYWQSRKKQWMGFGIRSELGRGQDAAIAGAPLPLDREKSKGKAEGSMATALLDGTMDGTMDGMGTSIFDPVLCELAYRWFSPKGGTVVDPFAGGSVRGIVAAKLGREYLGCDLRQEQVDANRAQAHDLCKDGVSPIWHCGDSRELDVHFKDVRADFIFSCPPYADLEVYSDDPRDLSTLEYELFRDAYHEIIEKAVGLLKQDRFACFVVGEVRRKGKGGFYRGFVYDTIRAFEDAGAKFYNELILVTAVGSLAIRTARPFIAARKVGKTHQNVLVFCKGDPKKAAEACGEIEVEFPEEAELSGSNEAAP